MNEDVLKMSITEIIFENPKIDNEEYANSIYKKERKNQISRQILNDIFKNAYILCYFKYRSWRNE